MTEIEQHVELSRTFQGRIKQLGIADTDAHGFNELLEAQSRAVAEYILNKRGFSTRAFKGARTPLDEIYGKFVEEGKMSSGEMERLKKKDLGELELLAQSIRPGQVR